MAKCTECGCNLIILPERDTYFGGTRAICTYCEIRLLRGVIRRKDSTLMKLSYREYRESGDPKHPLEEFPYTSKEMSDMAFAAYCDNTPLEEENPPSNMGQ